jgi:hypothetical protein
MTKSRIHGKEHAIKEVFSKDFMFTIPRYQRPYAWQIEQSQTLLEDLISALGDLDDDSDDIDDYFLGSIVVVKEEHSPEAEIVDGQQRLTTLTILLAVIRSFFTDSKTRDEITPFIFQVGSRVVNLPDHFRLTLREKDAIFFREYIQQDISLEHIQNLDEEQVESDSQRNIVRNARNYLEMLSKYSQKHIYTLVTYLLNNCFLIVVSTPSVDSAYRIFSILNDRGLDLSHSDILKAELIGQIADELQDAYAREWEDAEVLIGRDHFKDLFAHIRMIHLQAKVKATILKEIRQQVLPPYRPDEFIDKVVVPCTKAYDVIRTRSYQSVTNAEDVNKILFWLGYIDNFDWIPPAIAYYNRYYRDAHKLLRFLFDLERLAASMMIRRLNINQRLERYGRLLKEIEQEGNLYADDSSLQLSLDDKSATMNMLDGKIYHSGARVYILRRLDGELSETKTTPELPIYTIEHVMPQNPKEGSQWNNWYPDEEQRQELVDKLGNLALLSRRKNSQASNYEFEHKKYQYFNSPTTPFALTVQIINEPTWTPEVLERKQKEYLQTLASLWRLVDG